MQKNYVYNSNELTYEYSLELLNNRGVSIDDIVDIVFELQYGYYPELTKAECKYHIEKVLAKREVQNALITGIELDILAEKKLLNSPLQGILVHDESLYGVDEILALSIVNVYGSIGFTNYGYIDKTKPGIIGELNDHNNNQVNTFLDDLISAIAASSASRLAHNYANSD